MRARAPFNKRVKSGLKGAEKIEKRQKCIFLPFLKRVLSYMRHQLHIKYPLFLIFINMIFSDCFQSFSLASLLIVFAHSLYAKLIFFQVKRFSKITSPHTSIFENFCNINNSRRYSHFKITFGTFCLYNTAN